MVRGVQQETNAPQLRALDFSFALVQDRFWGASNSKFGHQSMSFWTTCSEFAFLFSPIPSEYSKNSSTADGMSPLGGIRGLAGGLSALAPASSDLTIQQMVRQGRRLDPLGQGYEILSLESFDTLTKQFRQEQREGQNNIAE